MSQNQPRDTDFDHQGGVIELERKRTALTPPPMFQVWLLNDDYTPMDFVVSVVQKFFYKSAEEAEAIMLQVHHQGRAVCGEYPRDVAETKVMRVRRFAREHGHPLECQTEGL